MVWKETSKFGIHTGRTLRKPWEPISSGDRGFLTKTVANTNINFTDREINECIKKFQVPDGLDDEEVTKQSRSNRRWGFGFGRGFSDDSVLYSIGKRKRWLLPTILKEKITEDYDSENDYTAVLVERLSVNSSLYGPSPRLRHGDCKSVLEGEELRKPKRRKFAHVGDLRKESKKIEIIYEVNHTEPMSSWPSYIQNSDKWRENRPGKAQCKAKGKKNKRRTWGGYNKFELKTQESDFLQKKLFDHSVENGIRDEKRSENQEHSTELHEHNLNFDIGNYIIRPTASHNHKNIKKHIKVTADKNKRITNVNPASSHPVHLHGKGSAIYIDPVTPQHGYHDNSNIVDFDCNSDGLAAISVTNTFVPKKAVYITVDIESEKLDPQVLHDHFGEAYEESASLPRRFSICSTNQLSKFVFTCHPRTSDHKGTGTERVTMTVISNELPTKHSQYCKEFLSHAFGIYMQESKTEEEQTDGNINMAEQSPVSERRVASISFDLLWDINKWSYKVSSPNLAVTNNHGNAQANGTMTNEDTKAIIPDTVLCEICCFEFYLDSSGEMTVLPDFSCTALKSCSHWFCNECWKSYLSAEVGQGKTTIKCPSYDCDVSVDDLTIMALLPERFLKFSMMRQEKFVEKSASWKWCPGDKCKLAVMATQVGKKPEVIVPLPVSCVCGHNWCFECQLEPHWPASCAEAALFHSKTETYAKLVRAKTGGITSVNVKRCPHCRYPIEKNRGCPHMTCVMCQGEFCWTCLGNWAEHDWGVACSKQLKDEEEVELIDEVGSTRFNYHSRVAIAHRIERTTPALYTKYSVIKKLEESVTTYNEHFECELKSPTSTTSLFLSVYCSHDVPKYLKASADLKFQAHLVIEGVSILMAVSKTKCYHSTLKRLISRLSFIVDRLEAMASARQFCSGIDKMHFHRLFDAGKHCIDCIRKCCSKVHHN